MRKMKPEDYKILEIRRKLLLTTIYIPASFHHPFCLQENKNFRNILETSADNDLHFQHLSPSFFCLQESKNFRNMLETTADNDLHFRHFHHPFLFSREQEF